MVYSAPITHIEKMERAAGNPALPGVPSSEGVTPYRHVFFGAQRDWSNDEVGWTKINHTKTIIKTNPETGERKKMVVRVNQRDINRAERARAGWNLDLP
jgi:hypothetical protein